MQLPLYIVNAFTDSTFGGNPAAVCPLQQWLPDTVMQQIAAQHNLSETAFFVRAADGFHIRWFTPTVEVSLCGHATLASAFVLFDQLGFAAREIVFQSKSGPLQVTLDDHRLTLNFPAQPPRAIPYIDNIESTLGALPVAQLAGEDVLFVLQSEAEVAALTPDFAALKQWPYRGVIVTAPGEEVDFVCRFFAPAAGINEDPVTGSAYTKLIPYWSERLAKSELSARQISARGGDILCAMVQDRVLISGSAVLYAKGDIYLPDVQRSYH